MSTGRKALVPLIEYNNLIEMKEALEQKKTVSLYVDTYKQFRYQPGSKTLTFYDSTEAQEKLVDTIKELQHDKILRESKIESLRGELQKTKYELSERDKKLREVRNDLYEIKHAADKGPWKTFKDYVLGRDSE